MSREAIGTAAEIGLFRPRNRLWELPVLHVPFDQLAGSDRYEQQALIRLTQGTYLAVMGASGAGKSSVIAWICEQLPRDHIALRIPITGVADPGSVGEVAQLALSVTLDEISLSDADQNALTQARADSSATRRTPASARATLGGGPIPAGLSAETASLEREFTHDRRDGDYLLALNSRLVPILVHAGLTPVFVFEDTEATVGGGDDKRDRAEAFFTGPLSAFVSQVDSPTLVAIQSHLTAGSPAFDRLAPSLHRLAIPVLAEKARSVVEAILTRRLDHAGIDMPASDLITAPGLDLLADFYRETEGDLRRVLAATQDALDRADSDEGQFVDEPHLRFGLGQWRTTK